jgi:hypothetical protein
MAETRVRIPVAVSLWPRLLGPFAFSGCWSSDLAVGGKGPLAFVARWEQVRASRLRSCMMSCDESSIDMTLEHFWIVDSVAPFMARLGSAHRGQPSVNLRKIVRTNGKKSETRLDLSV